MPSVSREESSDLAASPRRRPRGREEIQPLLRELKGALDKLYGERLARVVLYGSFARGDATDASDIDVLVVLRGEVNEWAEIKRMSHVTQPIALDYEELIADLPLSLNEYETRQSPLLINVRNEGIVL